MKISKPTLVAAAATMPIIFAPIAAAAPTACSEGSGVVRCQTNGSTSIKASPTTKAPVSGQQMGGLGIIPRAIVLGWGGY